jgi:hypothetical protein
MDEMKFQDPTLYTQTWYSLVAIVHCSRGQRLKRLCVPTGELEEAMSAFGDVTSEHVAVAMHSSSSSSSKQLRIHI